MALKTQRRSVPPGSAAAPLDRSAVTRPDPPGHDTRPGSVFPNPPHRHFPWEEPREEVSHPIPMEQPLLTWKVSPTLILSRPPGKKPPAPHPPPHLISPALPPGRRQRGRISTPAMVGSGSAHRKRWQPPAPGEEQRLSALPGETKSRAPPAQGQPSGRPQAPASADREHTRRLRGLLAFPLGERRKPRAAAVLCSGSTGTPVLSCCSKPF